MDNLGRVGKQGFSCMIFLKRAWKALDSHYPFTDLDSQRSGESAKDDASSALDQRRGDLMHCSQVVISFTKSPQLVSSYGATSDF